MDKKPKNISEIEWAQHPVKIELPFEALVKMHELLDAPPRPSLLLRAAAKRQRESRFDTKENVMTNYVVSAAIVDEQKKRILLTKRSADTTYPLHWCTPGGAVEDETQLEALRRELREEIEATFGDFSKVQGVVYRHNIRSTRSGNIVTVICYRIPSIAIDGLPSCGDKTIEIGWFGADELPSLQMTPADRANVEALIRAIEAPEQLPFDLPIIDS